MIKLFKEYYYNGIKTDYLVSNTGEVYSIRYKKCLKQTVNHRGYLRVGIYLPDGTVKRVSVHVMVLETFVGPKPTLKHQVDHIDGNKTNNDLSNLEWVTPSENITRAFKSGLKSGVKGNKHPVSVYSEIQIHKACKLLEKGISIPETSKRVGIPKSYLYSIAKGKQWNHIVSQYNLNNINKKSTVSADIKNEISTMISLGYKKSKIIKILNNKYGGDYKHIVYNYGR